MSARVLAALVYAVIAFWNVVVIKACLIRHEWASAALVAAGLAVLTLVAYVNWRDGTFRPSREAQALPCNVQTSETTVVDSFRNRMAAGLANTALRLATEDYRTFVGGSIMYGLEAAARDVGDAAVEQRYRDMTGMDDPLEVRAERARRNSERVEPLRRKTWDEAAES